MGNWSDNDAALEIAKAVADKCQGDRWNKDGSPKAPERYAIIYQAAAMGAHRVMEKHK